MARRLVNLTLDNLSDLPSRCRRCVFWELDPVAGRRAVEDGAAELEKEAWVSDTLLEWGSCGRAGLRRRGAGRLRAVRPAGLRPAVVRLPDLSGQRRTPSC